MNVEVARTTKSCVSKFSPVDQLGLGFFGIRNPSFDLKSCSLNQIVCGISEDCFGLLRLDAIVEVRMPLHPFDLQKDTDTHPGDHFSIICIRYVRKMLGRIV